ncbi:uncharacterized protein [Lepeophtheirus salmonis]|uniref:uncharacterized protein isoform X2 n=1 Tax=Lepeophtheirus salmonis TaxID=72036 RepID=UPI003AF3D954
MTSSVSGTTTLLVTIGGSSLMFLGGFCNVVVIWTILKSRNLYRCSINRTVLHLSFSSLLDLIINVPLTLIIINLNRFNIQPFDWICSAEILQQSLISTVQLFFISIIGIERLLSIINPYDRDSNLRRINVLIGIVWILGFIVAFLAWSFFPVNAVVYFCRKSSKYEDFYNNFLYVHQPIGLVVLFITILSYSGIVIRVFHVQSY